MIPLKQCYVWICGVQLNIFNSSSSNYRKSHTAFPYRGYFLALLLQCVSTSASQNVSMKDNVKNYLPEQA